MSSPSAIPDSNPTRAQLRLVVLGQWVQAGLALARGAAATRGLLGGAVALWQVFQAIRLAIRLAQRLSALNEVLSRAAPERESAETPVQGSAPWPDVAPVAACLRQALIEIGGTIREALGLGAGLSARPRRRCGGGAWTSAPARPPDAFAWTAADTAARTRAKSGGAAKAPRFRRPDDDPAPDRRPGHRAFPVGRGLTVGPSRVFWDREPPGSRFARSRS